MSRLIVVSNRLPVSISKHPDGIHFNKSVGGLATGLSCLSDKRRLIWIGWPGITIERLTNENKAKAEEQLSQKNCQPVFLSKKQIRDYYQGFSNKTVWPLFHYFPLNTIYEKKHWESYKLVNQKFCEEIIKIAEPQDYIWVHDYQLMLLPRMIRQHLPHCKIGFFLHIPFPSYELFRLLPWRTEILDGILGADLVGFHTYDYVRHFISSISRTLGLEQSLGKITYANRTIKVDAFPMGIDYEKYSTAPADLDVQDQIKKIRERAKNRKIIISIDRLDYTKGIVQRLEAFDLFLSENPKYRNKVSLIMVAVPSRTHVEDYIKLRHRLEQLIARVNGEYGTIDWTPVIYFYRFLPFKRLIALYTSADIALVTPLRDGMNLIAKEFIATKTDGRGVLILSEMAGAACELGEAITVNANDKAAIVQAIRESLEMPPLEQIERNRLMQKRLSRYTVSRWADDFINALSELEQNHKQARMRKLTAQSREELKRNYIKSQKRLFLLDYDGTLVGYSGRPDKAGPDDEITGILEALSKETKNELVIISGRDKKTLYNWLGSLNAALIAEHGAWIKLKAAKWQCTTAHLKNDWKEVIRPILEVYADRTPGAFVEEKDFSLVWHCRRADPELVNIRIQELKDALLNLTANLNVGVFEGQKILEVRNIIINKGHVAKTWLAKQNWNFILTAGDDYTDEEMFDVLPKYAYTVKVGAGPSKAGFNVDSVNEIRMLLKELSGL